MDSNYSYKSSGFNDFLTRSIDDDNASNLDNVESLSGRSSELNFDRSPVSGATASSFQFGAMTFDGKGKRVVLNDQVLEVNDSSKAAVSIGKGGVTYTDTDGKPRVFQSAGGINVSKSGVDVTGQLQDFQKIRTDDYSTELRFDDTLARMLSGYQKNGFNGKDYGIKISLDGFDVRTASIGQLAFSSSNSFTVAISGTYTFPSAVLAAGGSTLPMVVVTIPHNLGYTPGFTAFTPLPAGLFSIFGITVSGTAYEPQSNHGATIAAGGGTDILFSINAYVDNTNLYLIEQASSAATGGTLPAINEVYFVYTSHIA